MKNIKIVIGANYGDEGKGLATNFFAKQAKENKEKRAAWALFSFI